MSGIRRCSKPCVSDHDEHPAEEGGRDGLSVVEDEPARSTERGGSGGGRAEAAPSAARCEATGRGAAFVAIRGPGERRRSAPRRSPTRPAARFILLDSATAYGLLPKRRRRAVIPSSGETSPSLGVVARCGTTVGINCGGPEPGQNGTSDDHQNQAAAIREARSCALCLAALVLCASLFTAVFRETPDHVAAASRPFCVRRRRGGRRPQLAPRERSFGRSPRPAHRLLESCAVSDDRIGAFRRSRRFGRAVHPHCDRPRRLQGRERRTRASRR